MSTSSQLGKVSWRHSGVFNEEWGNHWRRSQLSSVFALDEWTFKEGKIVLHSGQTRAYNCVADVGKPRSPLFTEAPYLQWKHFPWQAILSGIYRVQRGRGYWSSTRFLTFLNASKKTVWSCHVKDGSWESAGKYYEGKVEMKYRCSLLTGLGLQYETLISFRRK